MLIISVECPACHTSFPVDPRKVPVGGVKVRCSVCAGVFFVEKPEAPAAAAPVLPLPETPAPEPAPAAETPPAADPVAEPPAEATPLPPAAAEPDDRGVDPWSGGGWNDEVEMAPDPWSGGMGLDAEPAAAADDDADPAAEESPPPAAFQFGKRDPHDKAKRLARVLVSDIITYNPDRHERALERDTLHADFEEEIRKSWGEYVEQVGSEIAEETPYWFDALNEILARGRQLF